jgi:hypothetical protein
VITNGDWFIVFHEASSLLSSVSLAQISIFGDLDDVEARIGELYELLSYQALSGVVPEQSPASLPKFLRSKGRAPAVLGWIVSANSYGERQLAIAVRVIAWVKIDGGGWIRFAKKYAEDFLVLSHEPSRLRETLRILKGRSNELLDSLGRKNIKLISAAAAEAMDPGANAPLSGSPPGNLCDRLGQGKYIVTLGKQTSYLISDRTWDDCAYHYYGRCKDAGSAASQHPIESPNTDPPTLFPSGSPFHCAHDNVHRAREEKCVVAEFESFLCCRKCAFFDRCWPDGGEGLPCVTNYEAK